MNAIKKPQVTIGMPVFNGEERIRYALDSLISQTVSDFEIIISDNASTDSTEKICLEYATMDKRIHYIRQQQNIGSVENFKFVLEKANGTYFMWAPDDDTWHPQFLANAISPFLDDPTTGLVFSYYKHNDYKNKSITNHFVNEFNLGSKFKRYLLRLISTAPNTIFGLHRTDVLRKYNLEKFDYYDVNMILWYTLEENIKVVPLFLYVIGINGTRIPYGLTGKYLNPKMFFREQRRMLKKHFAPFVSIFLFALCFYYFKKNTIRINKIIRESPNSSRQNEPDIGN